MLEFGARKAIRFSIYNRMRDFNMTTRACPVCNTSSSMAHLFLKENINPAMLSEFSFASRKTPEYMCHQMVHCPACDLVYVDSPPAVEVLAEAYHVAEYDSTEEANDAARAYARAITPVLRQLTRREVALEIGTGTGVFLEHLAAAGFRELVGVEPSTAAIAACLFASVRLFLYVSTAFIAFLASITA